MKPNQLEIGDDLLYHSEPSFPESIIPFGIQQLTDSPYNHISTVVDIKGDDVSVIEAIASGYKIRNIRDSITEIDKRVSVFRYHSDGVGGSPLTDMQKAAIVQSAHFYENAPYGYSQIVFLALLSEINNTTLPSFILRKITEIGEQIVESKVNAFIGEQGVIISLFLSDLVKTNRGLIICSEGAYRLKTENGIGLRLLNDDARKTYYKATGAVLSIYQSTRQGDLQNQVIADWVTPANMAESPDNTYLDDLEV